MARDGTLVGYIFSKRYKKVSPHRKSHNLLYNLLREKNKPPQEMVNKRGVPIGPTWLIRTLAHQRTKRHLPQGHLPQDKCSKTFAQTGQMPHDLDICPKDRRPRQFKIYDKSLLRFFRMFKVYSITSCDKSGILAWFLCYMFVNFVYIHEHSVFFLELFMFFKCRIK